MKSLIAFFKSLFRKKPSQPEAAPPAPSQGMEVLPPPTFNDEVLEDTVTIPYLHASQTKLLLQVKKDLDRHEAYREYAYPDPLSKLHKQHPALPWGFKPAREIAPPGTNFNDGKPWTVGFGNTISTTPDSKVGRITAERQLEAKILEEDRKLTNALPWYKEASFETRTILINMAFQMGLQGLLGFRNTLNFVKQRNYKQAASNMRQSLWAKQTPSRASELARRMETQEIPSQYKAPERL